MPIDSLRGTRPDPLSRAVDDSLDFAPVDAVQSEYAAIPCLLSDAPDANRAEPVLLCAATIHLEGGPHTRLLPRSYGRKAGAVQGRVPLSRTPREASPDCQTDADRPRPDAHRHRRVGCRLRRHARHRLLDRRDGTPATVPLNCATASRPPSSSLLIRAIRLFLRLPPRREGNLVSTSLFSGDRRCRRF